MGRRTDSPLRRRAGAILGAHLQGVHIKSGKNGGKRYRDHMHTTCRYVLHYQQQCDLFRNYLQLSMKTQFPSIHSPSQCSRRRCFPAPPAGGQPREKESAGLLVSLCSSKTEILEELSGNLR